MCIFLFLLIFISLHIFIFLHVSLSLFSSGSLNALCVVCFVCCGWAVRVVVVVAVRVVLVVVVVVAVDVAVCMCVRFFLSCTEKRFRVKVQNARVTWDTGVVEVHTGAFLKVHTEAF